ncbi:MAG: amino acid adenylation domain-containing protein [Symploca sp. SIO2C1]|nr:amino acid adenylation domain-containing protein [Symploca sp. SIO2C1]
MPTDYPCLSSEDYLGAKKQLVLSAKLTNALRTLSRQQGGTLFMTLLAAFKTLLYRYTGEEDIIVGTPVAGRNQVKTEKLMGCFLNSLAMRSDLSGNPTFMQLLHRVSQVVQQAYAHQDIPFEKVLEKLDLDRSQSHSPVFDVMLNLLNIPQQPLELSGLNLTPLELLEPDSQFSMTLYVEEHGSELNLILLYRQALFAPERMVCLLNQFQYLLEQMVANPEKPIKSYSLVTPESSSLLPDQSVALPEPEYEPVTNLFASWVKSTPEHPAICQGDRTWSYRELSASAEAIAQVLRSKGIDQGEPVAVCGSRSFGLIASMLGILLNGSVLLTIDQNLPQQRQQLILQEAKAKYLLYVGNQPSADEWIGESVEIINVAEDTGQAIEATIANLQPIELPAINPEDAAYIFFTSGTTGVPKGVLGVHKGLSHFLNWQRQTFDVGQNDRIAQLTGLSFDAVLRDIFLPLTSGATLCLLEATADLSSSYILPWLERKRISLLHTVPSLAQSWLVDIPADVSLRELRRVFFTGEPLTDQLITRWREAFPEVGEIINFYGPTETTMVKFYYRVPGDNLLTGVQPIGYPQPSTQGLILGENNQLCGIGEPGQIVIRTPFRSLGYINTSEENQQKFVQNPERDDQKDLLYYTGDRGRYRPDGSIEILGRIDHQVKIRGVRIEPGEIEVVLNQHPAVGQTLILAHEITPGDKRLIAYVILNQGEVCTKHELRDFVKQRLPNFMIPSAFMMLDAFPLTPNGKVDHRALPVADLTQSEPDKDIVAPRDQLERELTKIWEKVLGIQSIGIRDNFFDLGGNSLLAVSLIAKIQKTFDKNLSLATLFQEASTIEQLANILRQEAWFAPKSSIIPIQPSGSKNPFFFIHSIRHCKKLAPYLGSDQPCYCLSIFRLMELYKQKIGHLQLGDIAEQFIKDIRTVKPNGPYLLGVYCGDSRIAFEIAQQLQAQGEKVGLLAFIDVIWEPRKLGLDFYWHNFRQFGFSYLLYKVKKRIEFMKRKLILHTKTIRGKFYSRTSSPVPKYFQDVNLLNNYYQFVRDYIPQVYPGKITLFLCSEWLSRNPAKLKKIADKGLEMHEIPGYHQNIFEEPQILVLAEKLKACLDQAQQH